MGGTVGKTHSTLKLWFSNQFLTNEPMIHLLNVYQRYMHAGGGTFEGFKNGSVSCPLVIYCLVLVPKVQIKFKPEVAEWKITFIIFCYKRVWKSFHNYLHQLLKFWISSWIGIDHCSDFIFLFRNIGRKQKKWMLPKHTRYSNLLQKFRLRQKQITSGYLA